MIRKVITIDPDLCDGCGACVPDCAEGALQMIDGKARLVSDLFCDGLGACLGACPRGAIALEEREAEPYDEREVMKRLVSQGRNTVAAHLKHLRDHGEFAYLNQGLVFLEESGWDTDFIQSLRVPVHPVSSGAPASPEQEPLACGCPGTQIRALGSPSRHSHVTDVPPALSPPSVSTPSRLDQWPVQIRLVPVQAPFFDNADLLISADCVAYACGDFHERLLAGKVLLVGCPKLDDLAAYQEKLAAIFQAHRIRSVTVAHMEVPCCTGIVHAVRAALAASGSLIPFADVRVSVEGGIERVV